MAYAQKLAANTMQANAQMKETASKALQELATDLMQQFMSRCDTESNAGREFCVWQTNNMCIERFISPNITPEMFCSSAKRILDRRMQEQFNTFEVLFDFGEMPSKKNPGALVWVCKFEFKADWGRDRMQKEMALMAQREKQMDDRRRLNNGWKGDCHPTEYPEFRKLAMKFEMHPGMFLSHMEEWINGCFTGQIFAKNRHKPLKHELRPQVEEWKDGKVPADEYIRRKENGFVLEVIDAEGKSETERLPEEFQKILQWTVDWISWQKSPWLNKGKKCTARPWSQKSGGRQ